MREYKVIGPGAVLGLLVGFPAVGVGQEQSTPANQTTLEEVVVTGTSIRGAAPVGSNLITVGRAEIEASGAQTLAQVLRSVPAVTGFGNSGAGCRRSGRRRRGRISELRRRGQLHADDSRPRRERQQRHADPHRRSSSAALRHQSYARRPERDRAARDRARRDPAGWSVGRVRLGRRGRRVELHHARKYDGFEGNLQAAFGDGYDTQSAGFITGLSGDSARRCSRTTIRRATPCSSRERPYTAADHIPQGGGNFANFNCGPASVSPGGRSARRRTDLRASLHRRRRRQRRGEQLLRLLGRCGPHSRGRPPQPAAQARARRQRLAHADRRLRLRATAQRHAHQSRIGDGNRVRARQHAGRRRGADQSVLRRSGGRQLPKPCVSRPTSCSARARSSRAARSRCSARSRRTSTSAATGAQCSARRSARTTAGSAATARCA